MLETPSWMPLAGFEVLHTLKTKRCEQGKTFKVCLAIFHHYARMK